ncbi:MAG: hypothetical protein AAF525_03115 [Pseudomonadota bacterium]
MRGILLNWRIRMGLLASIVAGSAAAADLELRTFWSPDLSIEERFELAKRTTPELIAFIRRMPKGGDLHNHVSGATFADFLLDSAQAAGQFYDISERRIVDAETDDTLTIAQLVASPEHLNDYRNRISVRGWRPASGSSGHHQFFSSFAYIGSVDRSADEMLAEVVLRNHYQNVHYLELMLLPRNQAVLSRFFTRYRGVQMDDLAGSLEPLMTVVNDPELGSSIRESLDQFERRVDDRIQAAGKNPTEMPVVRYVGSLNRVADINQFFITAVIIMSVIAADERVVAINMVAPEDATLSRRQFDDQMKILDFLWNELGRPAVTLHGGELVLRDSPVEPMRNRIRRTIDEGHAQRIGHGISVAWEEDVVGLLEQMRRDGVMVEINLTSNEVILGIRNDDHPLQLYRRAGVPVCFTTDDEGVNRSNLTMEYVKAVQRYDLSYGELKDMTRNCLEYSFLPGQSLFIDHDYSRPRPIAGAKRGTKIERQQSLESAFHRFEDSLNAGFREAF